MGSMKNFADSETLVVTKSWSGFTKERRLALLKEVLSLDERFSGISISRALADGSVYVNLEIPLAPDERGTVLLDFEEMLKEKVDIGLTVWCEPLGDKSTLRNSRGIKIRAERVEDPRR